MSELDPAQATAPLAATRVLDARVLSGARWFWLIAAFSLVNIILLRTHAQLQFVVGLALVELANLLLEPVSILGYAIDALVVGFFALMGWLAQRGKLWAFVLGALFYGLDALLYAHFQDWLPVAFHALALSYIVRGAIALLQR